MSILLGLVVEYGSHLHIGLKAGAKRTKGLERWALEKQPDWQIWAMLLKLLTVRLRSF